MPSPILENLETAVTNAVGVMESAKVFIEGEAARLAAAIQVALANGATAEELAPVQAEVDALNERSAALAAAIAANPGPTPSARRG